MPLALSIQPFSDVLNMYGYADSSSTFSLSGHVSVSLGALPSLFGRRKATTRVLLQSLTITFEGQSETLSPTTGYASIRLCSITHELLPRGPVHISTEDHESDPHGAWNVIFDIPVPGWLPITSTYGDASLRATGTSYALYAAASFVDTCHGRSLFSLASIPGTTRLRSRRVNAHRRSITLQRFIEPQAMSSSSAFPMSVYFVDACCTPKEDYSRESIPRDVLNKIHVVASIPSATATDETSVPFILRLRGEDLSNSERKQLRITEFSVDVEQVEVYRNNLSQDDPDQFPIPIPSRGHQPPRLPLRDPHPIHSLYDTGFLEEYRSSVKRSFSILAPTESGRYVISGDGHIFARAHSPSPEDSWYILETKIPIFAEPCLRDWAGTQARRITESSPLFGVEHYMHVVIRCEYDLTDSGETIQEYLQFSLPMKHVNVPELMAHSRNTMEVRSEDLPAYSQLFYLNGERKSDHSIPLPLYEPTSSSSGPAPDQYN